MNMETVKYWVLVPEPKWVVFECISLLKLAHNRRKT
jgi:hypothetical protein